jgi:hypothetical protein
MASGVVALRYEDVVIGTALNWLVEWDSRAHELLLNLSETVETRLELKVVVAVALSDRGDDSDVVALGADVVCRRDDSDVDV